MIKIEGLQIHLRDFILEDVPIYRKWNMGRHAWMDLDGPYYPKSSPDEMERILTNMTRRIKSGNFDRPLHLSCDRR